MYVNGVDGLSYRETASSSDIDMEGYSTTKRLIISEEDLIVNEFGK